MESSNNLLSWPYPWWKKVILFTIYQTFTQSPIFIPFMIQSESPLEERISN